MDKYLIISEQPTCKLCGIKLKEWNPFEDSPCHIECISEAITKKLINEVTKQLMWQRI